MLVLSNSWRVLLTNENRAPKIRLSYPKRDTIANRRLLEFYESAYKIQNHVLDHLRHLHPTHKVDNESSLTEKIEQTINAKMQEYLENVILIKIENLLGLQILKKICKKKEIIFSSWKKKITINWNYIEREERK